MHIKIFPLLITMKQICHKMSVYLGIIQTKRSGGKSKSTQITYKNYLLLEINTFTKSLLIINGGCLFD